MELNFPSDIHVHPLFVRGNLKLGGLTTPLSPNLRRLSPIPLIREIGFTYNLTPASTLFAQNSGNDQAHQQHV